MDGANGSTAFTDSSSYSHSVNLYGGLSISTAHGKFGGASARSNGTGDYLTVPNHSSLQLNGDFTIEFFIRFNSLKVLEILDQRSSLNARGTVIYLDYVDGHYRFHFYLGDSSVISWNVTLKDTTTSVATNTWYYVALTKDGNVFKAHINNSLVGTVTSSFVLADITEQMIVLQALGYTDGTYNPDCYFDEFRITKGVARDCSVVPVAAFPNN
jgi:hypothetical protein